MTDLLDRDARGLEGSLARQLKRVAAKLDDVATAVELGRPPGRIEGRLGAAANQLGAFRNALDAAASRRLDTLIVAELDTGAADAIDTIEDALAAT